MPETECLNSSAYCVLSAMGNGFMANIHNTLMKQNCQVFYSPVDEDKCHNNIVVIDCAEGLFRLENWDFGSGKKSRCEKEKFPKRAVYLGDKKVHILPAEKRD